MAIYSAKALNQIREEHTAPDLKYLALYRAYADGVHNKMLTPGQRALLRPQKVNDMADNVLRLVLTMAASRLSFLKWEVQEVDPADIPLDDDGRPIPESEREAGPVKAYLDEVHMRNKMDEFQYDVHWGMFRDGNYAVSMSYRDRPRVHREPWWDGEEGAFIAYDRDREYEFAIKEWSQVDPETANPLWRRTVYYPDHFIRYAKTLSGTAWDPIRTPVYLLDGTEIDPMPDGSIPWLKADGSPLGIPMVHFHNGSRGDSPYGLSDLTGLLALQDDINSMQHDIAIASKFTGAPMIWTAGAPTTSGKMIVGPGRLLEFASADSKAGVLEAGDTSALTASHSYKREAIAINSMSPIPLITGKGWPSGEAILQARQPEVDKTDRGIRIVGPAWTQIAHQLTELANVADESLQLDEDAPITSVMADPRRLDELTEIRVQHERAKLMETVSRISDPLLLRKLEMFTEAEILALMAERAGLAAEQDEERLRSGDTSREEEMAGRF